jgi:hypothetical protein
MMHRKFLLTSAMAATLLGLAGCDQYDPLYRDGLWHPTHSNRADLTLMAANPADLVRGSGVRSSDGVLDATAIQRLHDGKVKKLPQAGLSDISTKSQGDSGD